MTDPGRQEVLRVNQLAREGRVGARHAPFAEHRMRLPYRDYMAFRRVWSALECGAKSDEAFWQWMESNPAADAYRVRSRKAQLGHL